jgi:uncharacterized membrane protein
MALNKRFNSMDIMRGIVMVFMALDHTRHFFVNAPIDEINLSHELPWLFFTRWITNLCAPVFLFLAGISVKLMADNDNDQKTTSLFLLKRGLWLIFLELTLMNFFWDSSLFTVELQILWIFGISFILMALLIFVPGKVNIAIAITLIVFHSFLNNYTFNDTFRFSDYLMVFLHSPGYIEVAKTVHVLVLYNVIPWSAILLLGYGMGGIYNMSSRKRKQILIISGTCMIIAFVVLRTGNLFGDPYKWSIQPNGTVHSLMSFLNIAKYPASLQFVLITLGPSWILLALLEYVPENMLSPLQIMGQVALFFYLVHIPLIRAMSKIYHITFTTEPSAVYLFLIWVFLVILLYFISKIYYEFKISKKKDPAYWWLKYL